MWNCREDKPNLDGKDMCNFRGPEVKGGGIKNTWEIWEVMGKFYILLVAAATQVRIFPKLNKWKL